MLGWLSSPAGRAFGLLELSGCPKVTDAGVKALTECQGLESLNLPHCEHLTDAGIQALSKCQKAPESGFFLLQPSNRRGCEEPGQLRSA